MKIPLKSRPEAGLFYADLVKLKYPSMARRKMSEMKMRIKTRELIHA